MGELARGWMVLLYTVLILLNCSMLLYLYCCCCCLVDLYVLSVFDTAELYYAAIPVLPCCCCPVAFVASLGFAVL